MRWGGAAARVSLVKSNAPGGSGSKFRSRFVARSFSSSFGSGGMAPAGGSARVPFVMGLAAGVAVGSAGAYAICSREPQRFKDAEVVDVHRAGANELDTRNELDVSSLDEVTMHPAMRAGWPTGTEDLLRVKSGYVAAYDARTRNPRWVLELINKQSCDGVGTRKKSNFTEDGELENKFTAKLTDYRNSGYDRGHLAAAAGHKTSQRSMDDTFSLINISPQVGDGFNRDYWARLEKFTRDLALEYDADVLVATGPLFLPARHTGSRNSKRRERELQVAMEGRNRKYIELMDSKNNQLVARSSETTKRPSTGWEMRYPLLGDAPELVHVPTHFFKLVVVKDSKDSKVRAKGSKYSKKMQTTLVAAFVLPNAPIPPNALLTSFCVPLSKLEAAAGLSFFKQGALGGTSRDAFDEQERLYFESRDAIDVSRQGLKNKSRITGPGRRNVTHICAANACVLPDGRSGRKKS